MQPLRSQSWMKLSRRMKKLEGDLTGRNGRGPIDVELQNLESAGTWQVVERPEGVNVVDSKWVFQLKKDAKGNIVKWKARLVARGFTQVQGVDYFETFAPVARLASIRFILAIAA